MGSIGSIHIVDSLINPETGDGILGVSSVRNNKNYYKVFIYLDGPLLPTVKRVTYYLHQTFENSVRVVDRTVYNPRCLLEIETWGVFTIRAVVEDKKGATYPISHSMDYYRELKQ